MNVGLTSWRTIESVLLLLIIVEFIRSVAGINCTTDVMELSTNISLEIFNISARQCTVQWTIQPVINVTRIEFIMTDVRGTDESYHTVRELDRRNSSFVLGDLNELAAYLAYLHVHFHDNSSCTSDVLNFTTRAAIPVTRTAITYIAETIIILGILTAWGLAVYLFINQWGNLRVTPERHPRFKHAPKNIESVKVVKRANDSIIYKNYGRQMSFTMEKRERRIERINTLRELGIDPQNIDKIDISLAQASLIPSTSSVPEPTISTIICSEQHSDAT